ncbi:MAG: nucleoside deaminase [Acidimicrobiales bacterium]
MPCSWRSAWPTSASPSGGCAPGLSGPIGPLRSPGDPRPDRRRADGRGDRGGPLAAAHGDVPVGALVVVDGRIVARRHNEREAAQDPTAHAELLAVRDAAAATGSWRLDGATVVVTLEPCPMCAGALQQARVARVVFGAADLKAGACGSLYHLGADPRLNHEFAVTHGIRGDECAELLTDFFRERR